MERVPCLGIFESWMYPDYVLFCVFQIEREMCEKKQTDEDGAVQDSDTESERDAREHSVRVHSPGMIFFFLSVFIIDLLDLNI